MQNVIFKFTVDFKSEGLRRPDPVAILHVNEFVRLSVVVSDFKVVGKWSRQESNLDLELRKLLYYPLYYETRLLKLVREHCLQIFLRQWPAKLRQKIFLPQIILKVLIIWQ